MTHTGFTTARAATSGVLLLDAPRRCAFVVRPGWMTPLTRSESRQRHKVDH